jgi:ABC-type antimicrobial peptide transport system permease subunit
MRPVIEGLLIGLGVALVLRQVLQMGMTETLSSVNVPTFALAAVPLVVAGLIAVYLPARRASLVDPLTALRHE